MMGCRPWTLVGALVVCGAAISLAACSMPGSQTGTESGNPSLEFTTTQCKSKEPTTEVQSAGRMLAIGASKLQSTVALNSRYDGLNCFVWQRVDDDTLRIEVTNHADGCSEDEYWEPVAELNDDGRLDLRLENPSCTKAACGWCIYDLSFTVQVPSSVMELDVRLFDDSCSAEAGVRSAAQLSLGSGTSGEVCSYANRYALSWGCAGAPGRYAPCSAADNCYEEGTTCGAGLSCAALDEPRCAPPCSRDADCADYASTSCVEGHCVLPTAP